MDKNVVRITMIENDGEIKHVFEGDKKDAKGFIDAYHKDGTYAFIEFVHTSYGIDAVREIAK